MRIIEAIEYLNFAVKENYISEEHAQYLMNLPWQETIKEVEKMMDRADSWAESVVKGEL